MGYIKVNQEKVTPEIAKELQKLCPFNAFDYVDGELSINSGCKICKICVNKGPSGVCLFVEGEKQVKIDKTKYKGITVVIQQRHSQAHKVAWELIGKALELAKKTGEAVYAVAIGDNLTKIVEEALEYGVDKVFVYESPLLKDFNVERYTTVIEAFFKKYQVNTILFGGTPEGRSLAPRVAARLKTGLTADCTMLDILPDGDLLQIRPAFGGNIMAKIHTPNTRPQMATIRYKMFLAPEKVKPKGEVVYENIDKLNMHSNIIIKSYEEAQKVKDISEAEIIVAVGRAFKKKKDLDLILPLVKSLGAEIACTRPLVENGWIDPRRQIGLSGRTVKPKLLVNLGISGSIQFIEGMKESEMIISVNNDPDNKLFKISDYAILGDIYEVLPELTALIKDYMSNNL